MVEVFKTNVRNRTQAEAVLQQIHTTYSQYAANFDLEDCDKILRVECHTGTVEAFALMSLFRDLGFEAEILADDAPVDELPRS